MTRKQVINRLAELGFEDAETKYYEIKDFLYYNRTPIKAIREITISDDSHEDTLYWTVHCWLTDSNGNDWGSVEV